MEGTDEAALAQARNGDAEAFRLLVERHSRQIFRLGFRMTGNEEDAEDVVQETFLRAYRQLERFQSRSNFGTWLYRIAVNCSLDLVRMRRRHEDSHDPIDSSEREEPLHLPTGDPTPERLAFSTEVQRRIAAAMDQLGPTERAVFVLRHFEGMSIKEIGETLGLKTSATKNNIFRAVRKLRKRLDPLIRA